MRSLFAILPLTFGLQVCDPALPLGGETAPPVAPGSHSGSLVLAGSRPMELVARTNGSLEVYGVATGATALSAEWPVSVQVAVGGDAQRIVSLRYRAEAGRFEGALPGQPADSGRFRIGYIAEGRTYVAEGTLAPLLPPGPPVVMAANAVVEAAAPTTEATPDAGATAAEASADEAPTQAEAAVEAEAPAEAQAQAEPPPAVEAPTRPESATEATTTRSPTTMSATTERRSSGAFPSSRRNNRR